MSALKRKSKGELRLQNSPLMKSLKKSARKLDTSRGSEPQLKGDNLNTTERKIVSARAEKNEEIFNKNYLAAS